MAHADDRTIALPEKGLEALLAYVTECLALLDEDGAIVYVNEAFARFAGSDPRELVGTSILSTIHPDDQGSARVMLEGVIAQPGGSGAITIRRRHADSSWRMCEINLHNRLGDPLLAGIVVVARDVTGVEEARLRAEAATTRLQALQRVTDVALAHLSLDALLRHVLGCIADVLRADNTAILLLDEVTQELTVHVARGPEEQVEGRMRIPLGQGLAGQIAMRNAPLVVEDLSSMVVVNPVLREHLRSFMGVPLRASGRVIGVLHAGTRDPHRFSDEDLQWLEVVADRVALAIKHAQVYQAEQDARAEAVARASETDAVLEAVADPVFVYNTDANIVRANAAARNLFGITARPDYLHLSLAERLEQTRTSDVRGQPLPRDRWPQLRVLSGERFTGAEAMDLMIHSLEGRSVRVSASGSPVRDAQGAITGGVLVLRDVTARWAAEETGRQQAALLALARDAVIVRAPTGVIIRWNAGAEVLYGWSETDVIGKMTHELLQTRVIGGVPAIRTGPDVDAAIAAEGAWEGALEHTRRDGTKLMVESRQALLRDDDQRPLAILEINRDVTARDAFLSAVTHDLKTPLTSIRGQAQLARRRLSRLSLQDPGPIEQPLQQIEEGTRQAQRLIDELTDVTRARSNAMLDLETKPADLVALVRAVVAQQDGLTRHSVEVVTDQAELQAVVDVPRVERVFANLLSNAVKYSAEGTSITVRVERLIDGQGPAALISVRDQGLGIPARDLPYIFDRFHRGVNVVGSVPGTGIGLASARAIVEQHGGRITVQSTEGAGATFTVRLPLAPT